MGTYGKGTAIFIKKLQGSKKIYFKKGEVSLSPGSSNTDPELKLYSKRELATVALQITPKSEQSNPELSANDKQILAACTGKDSTIMSHYVNDKRPHNAPRDSILCANLLRAKVPNAADVSHTLLQMKREELYTATCDKSVNCRNLLLRLCLDHAASPNNVCPVENWMVFTNSVIVWFDTNFGKELDIKMSPIALDEPDFSFVPTHRDLLQDWEQKLRRIDRCVMWDYRQALLNAYMIKKAFTTKERAYEQLSVDATCSNEVIRPVFAKRTRRPSSRDALIRIAIAMGCSLDETNLLLRQVPLAAVYPRRANISEELDDTQFLQVLKKDGLLDKNELANFTKEEINYDGI